MHLSPRALPLMAILALPACSPSCFLKPNSEYDPSKLASAPDYGAPENWAALPGATDLADLTSPGEEDNQASAEADVFFIYPTVYFSRDVWNDTLTGAKSKEMVDEVIMAGHASAFNACCRVYAPRYRQSSITAFFGELDQAEASFSIAYGDLERAFDFFLENHNSDRPFIIAGHSQGSMHAMRLLERIDADKALRERLIAAYIPGFALPMEHYGTRFQNLVPCASPEQTGCIASWDTYKQGAKVSGHHDLRYWNGSKLTTVALDAPRQCTNPISWKQDKSTASKSAHLGAVELVNEGEELSFRKILMGDDPPGVEITGLKKPRAKLVDATCDGKALRVPDPSKQDYPVSETEPGNYHLLDYELFYQDIRKNAALRTSTWLDARPAPAKEAPSPAPSPTPPTEAAPAE